jgi:uncharacterized membrane protein
MPKITVAQLTQGRVVQIACIICVLFGVFFRLFHADWKLYSYDETVTSLRASGHTYKEFEAFVHDGRTHSIGELTRFQAPAADTDPHSVLHSLAAEDPQHPPLYFFLTNLSERLTGDSVYLRRLPAILFGILVLPAAWWLAYELFGDTLISWGFAALIAVSPFHVEYAQQAREYSLWTLLSLVSGAFLFRALRTGAAWTYAAYFLSVAVGFWSFALFSEIAIAQALYLIVGFSAPLRRRFMVGAALLIGCASFIPWMGVMAAGSHTVATDTSWSATPLSAPLYIAKWLFNAGNLFFDLDYLTAALAPISFLMVGVAALACVALVRTAPIRIWAYVILTGGVSALTLLMPDLIFHQSRGAQSRYLTPLWLAVELALAYALFMPRGQAKRLPFRKIVSVGMMSAGILACGVGAFARTWWIAANQKSLPAIAIQLAQQQAPTLVSIDDDDTLLELLPLSNADLRFHLAHGVDAKVLGPTAHAFVIAKPHIVAALPVAKHLQAVALPETFPPSHDRIMEILHRRAAAERKIGNDYQDEQLYSVTPGLALNP